MPYARQYDLQEIRGMLQIGEGSKNVKSPVPVNKRAPAHAIGLHGGPSQPSLIARVMGKEKKSNASAYRDFDTLVRATHEIINSAAGQTVLAGFDSGATSREMITAALTNGNYYSAAEVKDNAPNTPRHSHTERGKRATEGSVLVEKFIAGKLWVQTSFPTKLI